MLRVQRYGWDRASHLYDRSWSRQLAPAQSLLLDRLDVQPGERVLEVACGSGLVTHHLASAVAPSGTVLATDLSGAMLERARERLPESVWEGVSFRRMDAGALDLPDGGFDAAACSLGLMYVPDPGAALREMIRVLDPGGRAGVAVWGARQACGWADIFPIVDARVESEVCPLFFRLGSGDTLAGEMQEAGLRGVEVERIRTTLEYATPEEALEAAFQGGPVAMAYSRFDAATRAVVHREYLASIAPFRSPDGYRIPGEFVVAVGRRDPR